jgi:integrase
LLYRFHCGQPVPSGSCHFQQPHITRSPLGYGRSYRVMASGIRLRQPRRVIVPLSSDEVANFWSSFHTFRDLALVALMLLDGLRSQETLDLQLEDLQLADAQIRVLGKGNRQRLLPLPPETMCTEISNFAIERLRKCMTFESASPERQMVKIWQNILPVSFIFNYLITSLKDIKLSSRPSSLRQLFPPRRALPNLASPSV